MFKFLKLFFLFLLPFSLYGTSFPGVIHVDENHYIAKLPGQEIYLIAEKMINSENIQVNGVVDNWRNFVTKQVNPRVNNNLIAMGLPSNADGASHFLGALKFFGRGDIEQWVVCATRRLDIPLSFDQNILMYMTVNTTPQSLVTTHMGIAGAVDLSSDIARPVNRPKRLSMDLHSFAAKVMLMRNPDRRFMINIPVPAMVQIIITSMPHGSVHYGTFEDHENLLAHSSLSFDDYLQKPEQISRLDRALKRAEKEQAELQSQVDDGEWKTLEEIKDQIGKKIYLIVVPQGNSLKIKLDKKQLRTYQLDLIKREFDVQNEMAQKLPRLGQSKEQKDVLELIQDNPPIIHGGPQMDTIEAMDPLQPGKSLFKADKNDPVYGYLFLSAFRTFGTGLKYVAVDLPALANLKAVDPGFTR